ncbi:MAG: helix-turn-helix transcriptional regulator [Burkholderiaceae bacterium]
METTLFLREAQVLVLLQVSRSTLYRWVQAGHFPQPVQLSNRVKAWRTESVRNWVVAQQQSSENCAS